MLIITMSHLVPYFILNLTDVYSEISFSECSWRAGTSQLICDENHLAHYCILRAFAGGVSEQICLVVSEQIR